MTEQDISDIFDNTIEEGKQLKLMYAYAMKVVNHDKYVKDLIQDVGDIIDMYHIRYIKPENLVVANLFDTLKQAKNMQYYDVLARTYECTNS